LHASDPLSPSQLTELYETVEASDLPSELKHEMMESVDAMQSSTSTSRLVPKGTSFAHLSAYLNSEDWKRLKEGNTLDGQAILVHRLQSLGVRSLKETTKKTCVALLVYLHMQKGNPMPDAWTLYGLVNDIAKSFLNYKLQPKIGTQASYPYNPQDLGADKLEKVYGEDKPTGEHIFLGPVMHKIACRSTSALLKPVATPQQRAPSQQPAPGPTLPVQPQWPQQPHVLQPLQSQWPQQAQVPSQPVQAQWPQQPQLPPQPLQAEFAQFQKFQEFMQKHGGKLPPSDPGAAPSEQAGQASQALVPFSAAAQQQAVNWKPAAQQAQQLCAASAANPEEEGQREDQAPSLEDMEAQALLELQGSKKPKAKAKAKAKGKAKATPQPKKGLLKKKPAAADSAVSYAARLAAYNKATGENRKCFGCCKCRGGPAGCAQCWNPLFQGMRFEGRAEYEKWIAKKNGKKK